MADILYDEFKTALGNATMGDLNGNTNLRIALYTSALTPSSATTGYSSTSEVATGGGYTQGGSSLASVTWSSSGATSTLDAADVSWSASTITARYAKVFWWNGTGSGPGDTGGGAVTKLICLYDFTTDQSSNNSTFTIQFNASGLLSIT
jgi:hypothetical protein